MPSRKKNCIECGKTIPGRWVACKEHITKKQKEELGKVYWRGPREDLRKKENDPS